MQFVQARRGIAQVLSGTPQIVSRHRPAGRFEQGQQIGAARNGGGFPSDRRDFVLKQD